VAARRRASGRGKREATRQEILAAAWDAAHENSLAGRSSTTNCDARATGTQEHENAPGARDRERVPGTGPAVRYNAGYCYLVMNRSERADLISGTVPIE
jgi:hypothetical protein